MCTTGVLTLLSACLIVSACGAPEDPARKQLRERLKESMQLTPDELSDLVTETRKTVDGKTVTMMHDGTAKAIEGEDRELVFGMLEDTAGLFDEGLRMNGTATLRVLNAPAKSDNAEVEASRKLWVDIDTLVPQRFEFVYGVPGYGDYAVDLTVK